MSMNRTRNTWLAAALCASLAACSDDDPETVDVALPGDDAPGVEVDTGDPDPSDVDTPEAGIPDGDTPDADTPGVAVPGVDTPDGGTPDGDTPDADTPDVDMPGVDTPDGETPDGDTPDADTPDGGTPDGDTPDVDMPGVDAPDGETPDGDTPDADTPDGGAPDGDTPDVDMPGVDNPDADVPDTDASDPARFDGIVRLEGGTRNVAEAAAELEAAIAENENLGLVAAVDHAANAAGAGLSLPPTGVALFGNPRLGTPLMLASRTAGLDLPQRLFAFEGAAGGEVADGTVSGDTSADDMTSDDVTSDDGDGASDDADESAGGGSGENTTALTVLWNDPAWVAARHGIEGEDAILETITGALAALGARAAGSSSEPVADTEITTAANAGIVTATSGRDFETTVAALRDAIVGAGPLTLVEELDHAANAARVGLELPPTRLFVFGNPALGTPLMQSMRTIGLDLPQKMLVWEDGDSVTIAWNDPTWLAARHGVEGQDELLGRVAGALRGLADAATGAGDDG